MNRFETIRQKYKPNKLNILFVAESPPQGGSFFYFKNSNLYSAILTAFQNKFSVIDDTNFLEIFKEKSCYLEDLCMDPVNGLNDFDRVKARMEGIPILADKLRLCKPAVLVTIMKEISPYIDEAIKKSEINPILKSVVPFPARSKTNVENCIHGLGEVLEKCIKLNLL